MDQLRIWKFRRNDFFKFSMSTTLVLHIKALSWELYRH